MTRKILILFATFMMFASGYAASAQTIIIVRHGETEEGGSNDPALSAIGEARGMVLKDIIKGKQPDLVISSQMKRTNQMAAIFTGDPAKVEIVPLTFIEGASIDTIAKAYAGELAERLSTENDDKIILVSTHGHVLPYLVKNLTGVDVPHTDCEYDHLVTVRLENGESTVLHGRYGNRTPACKG